MPEKLSRRDFTKRAATAAISLAAAPLALAQEKEAPKPAVSDADIEVVEKQLAKPLTEEARKILKATLQANRDAATSRLKTKLPENSEPCFTFHPTPVRGRS